VPYTSIYTPLVPHAASIARMLHEHQTTSRKPQAKPQLPESFQGLAEQGLREFRRSDALRCRWLAAEDMLEHLAGHPLSGELVNEVRMVLSQENLTVRKSS
jgi:hypothetical protein